jgi:Ca2+-binding RTX toxin-like protein
MLFLGLLMAGVAVGALTGAFDGSESDGGGSNPSVEELFETAEGEDGNDTIMGTNTHDLIGGADGNDDITGRSGDDILFGEDGDDLIKGRSGEDLLLGGDGNDLLLGGQGDDYMLGGADNDILRGAEGNDTLIGANTLAGDPGPEDLYVQDDRLVLGNSLYTPPTQPESNELYGEEGNDLLLLGEGDIGSGGSGNDAFEIGEWVGDETNVPEVTDFNPTEDVLVVRYDSGTSEPTITVDEQNGVHSVYSDGRLVAQVTSASAFTASDVQLYAVPTI